MMSETKKTRKAILRSVRRARKAGRFSSTTQSALRHRSFPLTFFIHNLLILQREPWWLEASPRVRKAHLLRMLKERSRIFLETNRWIKKRQEETGSTSQAWFAPAEPSSGSSYCSHCGGCCEIASGFPDFPPGAEIPPRWQLVFGDGLGRGHRFCAFLWEFDASGQSFCAIHPWRSNPCRLFEAEECEYFMNDLKANPPFDQKDFSMACQRLSHLIYCG